jgi:signal peptidase II
MMSKKNFCWIGFEFGLLILDLMSKLWIYKRARVLSKEIDFGFMSLIYVENTGAAFGMFKNNNLIFIILSVIMILVLCYLKLNRGLEFELDNLSLSLIMSGVLGNLINRISFGFVIDFIYIKKIFGLDLSLIDMPVFNLADMFLVMGCLLLLYKKIFMSRD